MKRLILFLLPLWMMACIPSNNEDVLSLSLSESMIEMKVGEYNTTLTASVTPASAIVTWTSSDESIVTVDDGILDSFDIVSLVTEVNDEFDVKIPASEIVPENFNSAESLWELIQRLMDE